MMVKKINKKQYFSYILLLIILLIIVKQTFFFRNAYFVIKFNYKERLLRQYEFCGYESVGFLNYIRNKYNLSEKIPIINFGNSPNPSWFYSDLKSNYDNNNKRAILLNYGWNQNIFPDLYNDYSLQKYKIIEKIDYCYYVIKK
jgi:hypothetical protein